MISFFRMIKFALQDLIRNLSLSFMTVVVLVLMLLSINTLIILKFLTNEATSAIKEQIDVSVFFVQDVTDEQVQEVHRYLSSINEVTDIRLSSREQVFEDFKREYKDNPEILESLDELSGNPLGPTMIVKTRDPKSYEKVITLLGVPEYEDIVVAKTFTDTEKAIEKIDQITKQVEKFSLILSVIFGVIAFLIIFNTVRVAIYIHRIEISIKKLVGATNWFIRGPYIIEALIFSIVSMIITFFIIMYISGFIDIHIQLVFGRINLLTNYLQSNIILVFGTQFIAVVGFTTLSSIMAMSKHLRA